MAEKRELLRRQQVLAMFGDFILDSEDLQEILTEGCRLIGEALGTDLAKILEIDRRSNRALVRAGVGWSHDVVGKAWIDLHQRSSEAYAIHSGEPLVTNDIRQDGRFDFPAFMRDEGVVALVNVPILFPGREPYGVLQVDSKTQRNFGEEEIEFLRIYAMVLGPVVDRLKKLNDLRVADEQYRLIVENARDHAIFLTDTNGTITAWPAGAQAVFGWNAHEAIGRTTEMLFTPRDRESGRPAQEIGAAGRDGKVADVRWHVAKDGTPVFIDGQMIALAGEGTGFMKIGQDVTERRKAEDALRRSEARTKADLAAMQQLQEVSTLLVGDHAPQYLYDRIVDAARALMQSDAASLQLLDRDSGTLKLQASCGLHPVSVDCWQHVDARGDSVCGQALRRQERVIVTDVAADPAGPAERDAYDKSGIRSVQTTPLRAHSGQIVGMLSTHWQRRHVPGATELRFFDVLARLSADLIERLDAGEDLRRSEERLRSAVEVGHLGLWDWNVRTGDIHWSDEHFRMEGYDVGEVTPSYDVWSDRLHPDDREETEAKVHEAMADKKEYEHEFRSLHPDGTVRWLHARGRFFYDREGQPLRMIGAMIDVTGRREWESRQNILIAELQHRTRNLIGVVRSIAAKTLSGSRDLAEFDARFSDRLQALARIQGLLSRLKDDERVAFDMLVRNELEGMNAPMERVSLTGPAGVRLRSSTVQTLAMALHELATNAAKYGAFRYEGAALSVRWALAAANGEGEPRLDVEWRESGVPIDHDTITRNGQGRELIEQALPYQLRAETSYAFGEDGVRCTISLPISARTFEERR